MEDVYGCDRSISSCSLHLGLDPTAIVGLKASHGRIMNEDVTLTLGPRKAVLLCGSEQFQRRQG